LLIKRQKININKAKNLFKNNDFFFSFINVIETSGLFLYFRIRAIAKKENSSICLYKNIQSSPNFPEKKTNHPVFSLRKCLFKKKSKHFIKKCVLRA